MSAMRRADPHRGTPCTRCGRPAWVIVVNRTNGMIVGYACRDCDTHALAAGPHLDYPLDANARQSAVNRAIENYNNSTGRS